MRVFFIVVILVLSFEGYTGALEERVVILNAAVSGKKAVVSFRLSNSNPPELVEVIKSGIAVAFNYEIKVKRVHKNWFDETVGSLSFKREIKFDPISREFIIRSGEGGGVRIVKGVVEALAEFFRVENLEIPLWKGAVSGKTYEIFVRAKLDELEISDVFKFLPFLSSWFEVKTDWAHLKVKAK